MLTTSKYISADLASMPDDGSTYEIIEGELYVSRSPGYEHQYTCSRLTQFLNNWNDQDNLGVVLPGPGLVFGEHDDVIPDVTWISLERFISSTDAAGHLRLAPELVVEVLSPGKLNEYRDREAKLGLYSRRGVQEYWIVDWITRKAEVYRRKRNKLKLVETVRAKEFLTSPLLPGFSCQVKKLFFALPK